MYMARAAACAPRAAHALLIAKIERAEAIADARGDPRRASDGIMVARGDLARRGRQRRGAGAAEAHDPAGARAATSWSITATQMMESMITTPGAHPRRGQRRGQRRAATAPTR
jgi:pyruvate kinase